MLYLLAETVGRLVKSIKKLLGMSSEGTTWPFVFSHSLVEQDLQNLNPQQRYARRHSGRQRCGHACSRSRAHSRADEYIWECALTMYADIRASLESAPTHVDACVQPRTRVHVVHTRTRIHACMRGYRMRG